VHAAGLVGLLLGALVLLTGCATGTSTMRMFVQPHGARLVTLQPIADSCHADNGGVIRAAADLHSRRR
jgi:hypothetical protein